MARLAERESRQRRGGASSVKHANASYVTHESLTPRRPPGTISSSEKRGFMKVLLVYPEFPDTYWSFRHAVSFVGKRSAFPPLGLLTVSAMLPASWEKRLVDVNVRKLKSSDIEWADIVFATAMLIQKDSLQEVVKRCKALGKPVAIGGPYVT